jgi:hypothetical protein
LCIGPGVYCLAQKDAKKPKPRAKPKKFNEEEVSRVFFDNVFDQLVGLRPEAKQATGGSSASPGNNTAAANDAASSSSSSDGWSQIISSAGIESEIKSIKLLVDKDVTTPSDFKGRGYKECRTHFSVAAALFGIINDYDGEVRWKSDAAAARDVFARTAANSKVGTAQVFNEAKQRKAELEDLLNGNGFPGKASDATNEWANIIDRSPLMLRMDAGFEGVVRPGAANANEFKANKDAILHEGEMISALATVLTKSGMEDADDETYAEFARTLRATARQLVTGTQQDNYEQVRMAVGTIDQTCNKCHDGYR